MARDTALGRRSATVAIDSSNVLSTAPASPSEHALGRKHTQMSDPDGLVPSADTSVAIPPETPQHSTAAQFSFGPATRQTVTTVTTTTTVSFPPLIIKPPRDLHQRDPKQYPLAYAPTPDHLRKFCTDYNGRPIRFDEQEDAQDTLRRHRELQARIERHNGSILTNETTRHLRTPPRRVHGHDLSEHNTRASAALKRAAPPSIAEAAEMVATLQRQSKRPRSRLLRTHSELAEGPSLNDQFPDASLLRDPAPATPDTDAGPGSMAPPKIESGGRDHLRRRSPPRSRLRDSWENEKTRDVQDEAHEYGGGPAQLGPPLHRDRLEKSRGPVADTIDSGLAHASVTTPPIAVEDLDPLESDAARRRPDLPSILTSAQHDASLPSPSLSPITAAANLASRQNTFDTSFARHVDEDSTVSGLDLDDDTNAQGTGSSTLAQQAVSPVSELSSAKRSPASAAPTIMDIPTMIDAFDCMPEALQSYLVYQFLRRSAKPTLQMVANVVNPALKCDPFNVLPAELGLNITRFLDYQSMCQAAQVSKRWRRLINSDEKAWRDLLERDDLTLPDGEVARAIKEGWGWQFPGEDSYERDLSRANSADRRTSAGMSDDEDSAFEASSGVPTRKRKSVSKHSSSSKKLKRRSTQTPSSARPSSARSTRLSRLVASAQGPNCLAAAATQAVPQPAEGLPGLGDMHLFKSLYQRHHLIRKAWMTEDSQPQHLAFRAHHHHVVTCLLFDGDKILTGSDDAKINVYDTATGALRNRLDGHEGGVWALQYDGDTLVSGSTDRSVRVWDIKTGRCLQVFQGHTSTVRCLLILKPVQIGRAADGTPIMMPKEPLIITGSRDSTLRVWKLPQPGDRQIFQAGPPANDRDNPYFLRTLSGHHNSVRAIAAHGDTLISGSYDYTLRVWKISNGDLVHRLQGHTQKVYSVVLDHARDRCISGSMDNLVKVWDLQTGSCVFNLEGHSSLVGLLDLGYERLVSAAADSTLRIWDPETGACKATLSAHTGAITCFQHDGHKVISGSDRTLKMWNVRTGECVRDLLTDLTGVWQVRFDQRRCVAAVQRNGLTYIELLDFGAARDGIPADRRGRRILVDPRGREIEDIILPPPDAVDPPDL